MKGATLSTPLAPAKAVFNFRIHRVTLDDPEIPLSLNNCTKDEVRADFLRPPHKHLSPDYCAFHVLVQSNFRRYYFYFLSDQAQILLDNFNVFDELWGEISTGYDNRWRISP